MRRRASLPAAGGGRGSGDSAADAAAVGWKEIETTSLSQLKLLLAATTQRLSSEASGGGGGAAAASSGGGGSGGVEATMGSLERQLGAALDFERARKAAGEAAAASPGIHVPD